MGFSIRFFSLLTSPFEYLDIYWAYRCPQAHLKMIMDVIDTQLILEFIFQLRNKLTYN